MSAGAAARVVMAWDADGGSFGVGELLRVRPRDAARSLAMYRTACEQLLASREPLPPSAHEAGDDADDADDAGDTPLGSHTNERARRGSAEAAVEAVEAAAEAEEAAASSEVAASEAAAELASEAAEERLGVARGAAAVIKAQSAGELRAMLDFLDGRKARRPGAEDRLVLVHSGVGVPRREELLIVKDVLRQRVPCKLYTLSVRTPAEVRKEARKLGVEIKEYAVFHELLTDLLHSAGLPGPARELASMKNDGTRSRRNW